MTLGHSTAPLAHIEQKKSQLRVIQESVKVPKGGSKDGEGSGGATRGVGEVQLERRGLRVML